MADSKYSAFLHRTPVADPAGAPGGKPPATPAPAASKPASGKYAGFLSAGKQPAASAQPAAKPEPERKQAAPVHDQTADMHTEVAAYKPEPVQRSPELAAFAAKKVQQRERPGNQMLDDLVGLGLTVKPAIQDLLVGTAQFGASMAGGAVGIMGEYFLPEGVKRDLGIQPSKSFMDMKLPTELAEKAGNVFQPFMSKGSIVQTAFELLAHKGKEAGDATFTAQEKLAKKFYPKFASEHPELFAMLPFVVDQAVVNAPLAIGPAAKVTGKVAGKVSGLEAAGKVGEAVQGKLTAGDVPGVSERNTHVDVQPGIKAGAVAVVGEANKQLDDQLREMERKPEPPVAGKPGEGKPAEGPGSSGNTQLNAMPFEQAVKFVGEQLGKGLAKSKAMLQSVSSLSAAARTLGDLQHIAWAADSINRATRSMVVNAERMVVAPFLKEHGITMKDLEEVYHRDENPQHPLNERQQAVYDNLIVPLKEWLAAVREERGATMIDIPNAHDFGFTPRYVIGKRNYVSRLLMGKRTAPSPQVTTRTPGDRARRFVLGRDVESGQEMVMHLGKDENGQPSLLRFPDKQTRINSGKYEQVSPEEFIERMTRADRRQLDRLKREAKLLERYQGMETKAHRAFQRVTEKLRDQDLQTLYDLEKYISGLDAKVVELEKQIAILERAEQKDTAAITKLRDELEQLLDDRDAGDVLKNWFSKEGEGGPKDGKPVVKPKPWEVPKDAWHETTHIHEAAMNRELMQFTNVHDALKFVAAKSANPVNRVFAKTIIRALGEDSLPLKFDYKTGNLKLDNAAGWYSPSKHIMNLRSDSGLTQVILLHEAAHAATVRVLSNMAHEGLFDGPHDVKLTGDKITSTRLQAAQELTELYALMQKKVQGMSSAEKARFNITNSERVFQLNYSINNIKEFVSQIFSDPGTRAVLDSMQVGPKLTGLKRFTKVVLKLLGLEGRHETALARALDASYRIMSGKHDVTTERLHYNEKNRLQDALRGEELGGPRGLGYPGSVPAELAGGKPTIGEVGKLLKKLKNRSGVQAELGKIRRAMERLQDRYAALGMTAGERARLVRASKAYKELEKRAKTLAAVAEIINPGRRRLENLRNKYIPDMEARIKAKEQQYANTPPGRYVKDSQGRLVELKNATTKQIEAVTDVEYGKHVAKNYIHRLMHEMTAAAYSRAFERMKEAVDPAGEPVFVKADTLPMNSDKQIIRSPWFSGLAADKKVVQIIEDITRQGYDDVTMLQKMTNALVAPMFLIPFVHQGNILAHYWFGKGLTGQMLSVAGLPVNAVRFVRGFAGAMTEVLRMGPEYLELLANNAGFMHDRVVYREFLDNFARDYREADPKFKTLLQDSGIVGLPWDYAVRVKRFSDHMMWAFDDTLKLLHLRNERARTGKPMAELIKEMNTHIPDYRVPSQVMGNRLAALVFKSGGITLFGPYHYGILRSMFSASKDVINGMAKRDPKLAMHGLDLMAGMAVTIAGLWPVMNYMVQLLTGNSQARVDGRGPFKVWIEILNKMGIKTPVAQALDDTSWRYPKSARHIAQEFVMLDPTVTIGLEAFLNLDTFTGKRMYNDDSAVSFFKSVANNTVQSVMPLAQYSAVASGKRSAEEAALSMIGISSPPRSRIEKQKKMAAAEHKRMQQIGKPKVRP